jgi:predicted lipoprotein with Yx(FWY)xxD motif
MNPGRRSVAAAGGILAGAALMAGCGGGGYNSQYSTDAGAAPAMTMPGTSSAPTAPAVKSTQSSGNNSAPGLELVLTQTKALGWVVADGKGWILYRFDKDRAKPKAWSACTGVCAQKWPPVLVHGSPALKGVSSSIVGKMLRPDGTWQLTLHGWPVYRFAGDTTPGQWKGQGVGGTWHTIKRTGARNTIRVTWPTAPQTTASGTSSGSASTPQPTITDPYGNTSSY